MTGFVQILPAKSGLLRSIPVSSTATIVDGFPVVIPQASGASMSTLLALFRPQSWPKAGSFGVNGTDCGVDGRVGGGIDDPGSAWSSDRRRGGDPPPQLDQLGAVGIGRTTEARNAESRRLAVGGGVPAANRTKMLVDGPGLDGGDVPAESAQQGPRLEHSTAAVGEVP